MKLYNVPRNCYIRIYDENVSTPPGAPKIYKDLHFHHVDGMYSYCKDIYTGQVYHIGASTEVVMICNKDGNPIKTIKEYENQ